MTPLRRDTRVFISAVSKELGTVRKLVKKLWRTAATTPSSRTTSRWIIES